MFINFAKLKSRLDVFADCVSAPRNLINGFSKGLSPILPFLVVLQGSLAIATGSYTAATSFWELRKTEKRDKPGIILNTLTMLAGIAQTSLGCAATTCGSETLANNAHLAAGAGDAILPSLMGVYGLFLVRSVVAFVEAEKFERALANDDKDLTSFLCLSLKNPEHVKRMLGEDCYSKIERLGQGRSVHIGLLKQKIARECLMNKVTHIAVIAICLIGITATYLSFLLEDAAPLLSAILYAIGAVLWVFIDNPYLHQKLRECVANRLA